ncbi:hypothetical protein [Geodermatophilus sp. CPCC 206100]|uniref:hypothetical protein n=1 Tax=Geodermatophilus sp. CPCC 206100 TaxID=3020054 RepID=UPI003AFF6BBE
MPRTSPTQRMAAVLRQLARRPSTAFSTDDLRALCAEYRGTSGNRTLRRDLRQLRERGFIETGLTERRHDLPNRMGVRLNLTIKGPHLHLSPEEHAALARARERLRPGPATVEVRAGSARPLDLALAVVRHLEEGVGEADGHELAVSMGVPMPTLHEALAALVANPVVDPAVQMADRPALEGLDLDSDVDDETGTLLGFTVWLEDGKLATLSEATSRPVPTLGSREPSVSPAAGRGLDRFGRFAYTGAETQERLDLTRTALTDPATDPGDRAALQSAERKLEEWHDTLHHSHELTGDPGTDVAP